jgi:hypothetical protein
MNVQHFQRRPTHMDNEVNSTLEMDAIQDWDLYEYVTSQSKAKVDSLQKLFIFSLGKLAHIHCQNDIALRELLDFIEQKSIS